MKRENGRKSWRLIFLGFGLLCLLQAALNISLRLTFVTFRDGRGKNVSNLEAIINNLTQEKDHLKDRLITFEDFSKHGWLYFNKSFYHISAKKKSWENSRKDCQQRGADLVIINSKEEQDFTRLFRKMMWIGLTDADSEGNWTWVDGTPMKTSFWYSGEPNSYLGTEEDCGEIRMYDSQYSWNDALCKMENFWICEKRVDL